MNTAQETLASSVFPSPCSAENVAPQDRADLPTDEANNKQNQFAANAYHVPPKRFAPRAYPYRRDDTLNLPPETEPLPQRCQFMFSDGRQCTMARSEIHPSLCTYHSEREEQLFGTPGSGRGAVVGGSFDLAELYSASADLTTAAGVNRALAQVFRLLAQRRISRQEAATFGHLAKLLLRTVSLMSAEVIASHAGASNPVILSEQRERRNSPNSVPEAKISPPPRAVPSHAKEVQPPPNGYVMKADPQRDASSIFCRPTMPVVGEERFVLSGTCLAQSTLAQSSSATHVK